MDPLEINGDPPRLAGLRCDAILCVEFWHAGSLVTPAAAVYLCFEGRWQQLSFDCGIIFWRAEQGAPQPFSAPEIEASYPVVDVGAQRQLIGVRLSEYQAEAIEGGARVTFTFDGGQRLTFSNIDDTTTYDVASLPSSAEQPIAADVRPGSAAE